MPLETSMETIYIPKDETEHIMIKGLLESANINFFSKGEEVQSLFGWGHIGSGYNLAAGPIHIQVAHDDFDRAKEIITAFLSTRNESNIPDTCPACNSATNGHGVCSECGLVFISDTDLNDSQNGVEIKEDEILNLQRQSQKMILRSILFGILWFFGIGSILSLYYSLKAIQMINHCEEKIPGIIKTYFGLFLAVSGIISTLIFILSEGNVIHLFTHYQ